MVVKPVLVSRYIQPRRLMIFVPIPLLSVVGDHM